MNEIDWCYLKINRTLQELEIKYKNTRLSQKQKLDLYINELETKLEFMFDETDKIAIESIDDLKTSLYLKFKK